MNLHFFIFSSLVKSQTFGIVTLLLYTASSKSKVNIFAEFHYCWRIELQSHAFIEKRMHFCLRKDCDFNKFPCSVLWHSPRDSFNFVNLFSQAYCEQSAETKIHSLGRVNRIKIHCTSVSAVKWYKSHIYAPRMGAFYIV